MVAARAEDRSLVATIAAHERWAREPDRAAATEAARRAFRDRFERQVDPDGTLPPAERARRAEHARKAYYTRLALRSAQSRRRAKQATAEAEAAERELAEMGGGADAAA